MVPRCLVRGLVVCDDGSMKRYDPGRLDELGSERLHLRESLARVNEDLDAEISKATRAGIPQAEIARRTRLTRESVAQKSLPAGQRWKRGAVT
jgi:hypothetical protein